MAPRTPLASTHARPESAFSCVIFDLDGTLVDSAAGVIGSIEHAFREEGIEPPPPSELGRWLGPPMMDSLRERAGLDEESARAVHNRYRADYDTAGVLRSTIYEGVDDLLSRLRVADFTLAIATAKPHEPTLLLLEHLGLTQYFTAICGAAPGDGRSTKLDVLDATLRMLRGGGVDVARAVVVGDRHHDIQAAAARSVAAIFVTWGYGEAEEAKGASAIAASPGALEALLMAGRD